MSKTGVLLINLGSPSEPTSRAVKTYLTEFLMDPFVIDIPYLFRFFLVNGFITPFRSKKSALLYQNIWTKEGSPLVNHTLDLANLVQKDLSKNYLVKACMRYGNPSIESALDSLVDLGCDAIIAIPLYPQYSLSAWESSSQKVKSLFKKKNLSQRLTVVPPFYNEERFLESFSKTVLSFANDKEFDHYLFSFHGLPEHQITKLDSSKSHCLKTKNCCDTQNSFNQKCYRQQCVYTARKIAEKCKIDSSSYTVCFQSRLGNRPWIQPNIESLYESLPKEGKKHVAVISPSFVADCLETLEEISFRGQKDFESRGGKTLTLIPSLNSSRAWVETICHLITKQN